MRKAIIIILTLFSIPTFACSVARELSTAEKFAESDHVLVAKITSAKLVIDESAEDPWERETVEAKYELIELFKGDAKPAVVREAVFGPGNCMMGLTVGNMYVLFLNGPERFAGWPAGSFMVWNLEGTQVVPILEELRTLSNELRSSN